MWNEPPEIVVGKRYKEYAKGYSSGIVFCAEVEVINFGILEESGGNMVIYKYVEDKDNIDSLQ